jgi:hypothetical protein
MAGYGGQNRKPPDQRARKNKDPIPMRIVEVRPTPQPLLPADIDWHSQTVKWWLKWGESALSSHFTDDDWSELLDTALIHNRFWNGDMRVAGELRLRAAKFGATPEDRARLRIQVTTADEVEAKAEARGNVPASRQRYQRPQAG